MKHINAWFYATIILVMVLLVALLVFIDNDYEHANEILKESNQLLPTLLK